MLSIANANKSIDFFFIIICFDDKTNVVDFPEKAKTEKLKIKNPAGAGLSLSTV
jgi:hypothetical protein